MQHRTLRAPLVFTSIALASGLAFAVQDGSSAQRRLTLEGVSGRTGDPVRFGRRAPRYRWAPDGVHFATGRGKDERWIDPVTLEERSPLSEAELVEPEALARRKAHVSAFAELPGLDERDAGRIVDKLAHSSEDGQAATFRRKGALWFHRVGETPRQLIGKDAKLEFEELSASGEHVAFVRDNDLHLIDTTDGSTRALTSDGSPERFNGKLDWVYQEEIYGRGRFKAFWWSPTGAHIAFLSLDESRVHEFTLVDNIAKEHFRSEPEVTNYPKAGDPNPSVKLGIANAETGEVTWVDLERYADSEPLVVRVSWAPDGARLLFQVQDRIQTWLELVAADPATGTTETLIQETSDSWVNVLGEPRWLQDGSFFWLSERTGFNHLYHYGADGTLIEPLTEGEWAVRSVSEVDEENQLVWFRGTKDGAIDDNTYRTAFGSGPEEAKAVKRLTEGRGSHSVRLREDQAFFLDRYSSLTRPEEWRLCSADGEVLHVLPGAESGAEDAYERSAWELFEVEARDGFALDVALLKPVPFDPEASYPVWLPTYSGPESPSVQNSWNSSTWYQFLAQQGVIVMQVNVRSASHTGRWATAACYKQLGVQELADLEDAVAWITANPWADAKRVGITGHSYGGFMTAFALTHSDLFALGIAGSGVYDWRMYDTVYTERYMSTPQKNPEGYVKTSVIKAAENLKGHLVVFHGTLDDNVHLQNAMQLVYALQKADKDFDLMLYPETRHGIRDSDLSWHKRKIEWRAMREHLIELGPGAREGAEPIEASSGPTAGQGR